MSDARASSEESEESAASARLGDARLALRAVEIGRTLGRRWRNRYASIDEALASTGIRYELRAHGGLGAGRCVLSEYHDVGDRVFVYADAVASVARRIDELGIAELFPPARLVEAAAAHELFHWIHRRGDRAEIDAALGCVTRVWGVFPVRKRAFAAEEVAAHAFAAAFHRLPRSATVLEWIFEQDRRRAASSGDG